MKFYTALVGSYPKPVKIAKVISRLKSGKIEKSKAYEELMKFEKRILEEVKEYELDYTTDGMVGWDDIADLTTSFLEGVEKGALERFFDNNFYYRKIVINQKLGYKSQNDYVQYFKQVKEISKDLKSKIKIVILGPLTFLQLAENNYYDDVGNIIDDYAKSTNSLLRDLIDYYDVVEVHEPSLFQKGIKGALLQSSQQVYEKLFNGINKEKHVLTYFDIRFDRIQYLLNLPADYFGFDVTEQNKTKLGRLYGYMKDMNVYLGVIDSRNTKMDKISTIRRIIEKVHEKGAKSLIIGNSSFNDFIPEIVVRRKLKLLQKTKRLVANV
ncbi:5-methyltetrahydropteroyltriglutamate--homocysteine methyltransferase [Sulfolobus acidocaldarius]|uniref:Methionine synthase n=3 Tax=Sulfolobus acidocaldarius TaxID=2285 RepID=Q4JAI5_SULAC|nr:5-methyltetrahydropteroyltriglutamate--homocysteine methyltransferase [Sulfolobus acidocaldarius]AAY80194.1 methionine synthase [Sulfolobus acidocaldarius DSM 639]AGE70773.1 5-methyltetrahydropteroyltriglutamate--homocysteine methyltransferase [Sulfolobus acidocaldarius N8]AGE73044.1 5-methyltetrahydropteroyltriglutamate--homocysteine methyltransferase [Sulfolobus acidocaldarius Ron12/I]WCM34744.1 5-methyltetrahydropteroyltriglutamate--homocysteine methyltransferase [Sulfolobus acidocaldariu